MIPLSGEQICKVDAKGRFLFPTAFKCQFADKTGEGFVLKKSIFSACLELYPKANWDELFRKINLKLNRFKRADNDFIRAFSSGLKNTELDNFGRILIPRDLLLFSNITAEIVLTAKMDSIEIWDKAAYDKIISETQPDISDMAETLFGNINLNE